MEARISILCSHLLPIASNSSVNSSNSVRRSPASSSGYCVFCRIVSGVSPAFVLYEDDACMCILDSNPLTNGHSLIIPKSHFSSLDTTPPSVIAAMCSKIPFISNALKKATDCDSFNLLVNNGGAAGQVVFHTHIHIIPRKAQDCLWDSESLRRYPLRSDGKASKLVECVREHLKTVEDVGDSKCQGSFLSGS